MCVHMRICSSASVVFVHELVVKHAFNVHVVQLIVGSTQVCVTPIRGNVLHTNHACVCSRACGKMSI